ncbi:MAG: hypothetical protein ACR2NZ_21215 [Rubripirellula sp.]
MTSQVLVQCPTCSAQMKVTPPQGPAVVTCPGCGQQIKLAPSNAAPSTVSGPAPTPGPAAGFPGPSFTDLPAPSPPSRPSKPAGSRSRTPATPQYRSAAPKKAKRKKPLNLRVPLIVLGCLLGTATLGVVGYFAWDKLPTESLTSLVPIVDSPEKVLKDYVDIADDLRRTLDSIDDEKSRDKAIPQIQGLTERCSELSRRAVAVGPLKQEKLQSLGSWIKTQVPEKSRSLKTSTERVSQRKSLATPALTSALLDLVFALSRVDGTLKSAWTPLPEPSNPTQQVEYEIILVRRSVWGAVASVASERAFQNLDGDYADAAEKLEAIIEEHTEIIQSKSFLSVGSPYFGVSVSYSVDTGMGLGDLIAKYGEMNSSEGVNQYNAAISRMSEVQTMADVSNPAGFPGGMDGTGSRFGAPGRPPFRGRPPGAPAMKSNDEVFAERIERYKASHGDNIVIFRFRRKQNSARIADINLYLRRDMGAKLVQIQYRGEEGLGLCICDAPISKIAAGIDWGTVTSTNKSDRTIHVTIEE